jgi:hypothetical protein
MSPYAFSETPSRIRPLSLPRVPIIIPPIPIHDLKLAQIQPILRLVEGDDVDAKVVDLAALVHILCPGEDVHAALVAEEAVRILSAPLVVRHLVLGSRGLEREVGGRDVELRGLRLEADGAVAARRHRRARQREAGRVTDGAAVAGAVEGLLLRAGLLVGHRDCLLV